MPFAVLFIRTWEFEMFYKATLIYFFGQNDPASVIALAKKEGFRLFRTFDFPRSGAHLRGRFPSWQHADRVVEKLKAASDGSLSYSGEVVFDREEILQSQWLMAGAKREPSGELAQSAWHRVFDRGTGCQRCWTGATQVADLELRGLRVPKRNKFHVTHDGFVLVKKHFAMALSKCGVDMRFRPVRDYQGRIIDWMQLVLQDISTRMTPRTQGMTTEGQCPLCQKDGFFNIPHIQLLPSYNNIQSFGSSSCVETWECFGLSNRKADGARVVRIARGHMLIRVDIASHFLELGCQDIGLTPVLFERQ